MILKPISSISSFYLPHLSCFAFWTLRLAFKNGRNRDEKRETTYHWATNYSEQLVSTCQLAKHNVDSHCTHTGLHCCALHIFEVPYGCLGYCVLLLDWIGYYCWLSSTLVTSVIWSVRSLVALQLDDSMIPWANNKFNLVVYPSVFSLPVLVVALCKAQSDFGVLSIGLTTGGRIPSKIPIVFERVWSTRILCGWYWNRTLRKRDERIFRISTMTRSLYGSTRTIFTLSSLLESYSRW